MKRIIPSLLFICIKLDVVAPLAGVRHDEDKPTHHPVNIAVLTGQRFKFYCIPDSSKDDMFVLGISFLKYDHNSSARDKEIFGNFGFLSKVFIATYSVTRLSNGNGVEFSSIINDAAEFAGSYACQYANDSSEYWYKAAAELVVIESDPTCVAESNIYVNTTVLRCAVNFIGNYYPRMEWRSSNGTLLRKCDEQSVRYADGLLSLRCDVNVTGGEGEGAQCRTFFTAEWWRNKAPILDATYSEHVPSYCHTYTHPRYGADEKSNEEHIQGNRLNNHDLLIILVAAAGGTLVVAALVVVVLQLRRRGCGSEKKVIASDVVTQTSMLDSDLHLDRRTAQDNDYAAMPEGRRAAAASAPPVPSPRPPADLSSSYAANEPIVGADGTIYARLDLAARQASQTQRGVSPPPLQPPRPAEHSIYAFIDHTLRVEDLRPRAANKRK